MLIGGIYRSPHSTVVNSRHLNDLITMAVSLNFDYTVLVGDFNYPNITWTDWTTPNRQNHPEFKFIECLRDNYLNQFINHPTRYREGQRANILDLLIVDKLEVISKIVYSPNLGASDHVCFLAELICNVITKDSDTEKRNFYKGNYDKIREELSSVNWETMSHMNVEESWNFFLDRLKNSVDRNVPLKKVHAGRRKQKWVYAECLQSIKLKRKQWNRYIHTKDRIDYLRYCQARNQCTKAIRMAKKNFEQNIIKNVMSDPKGFWGYVRDKTKSRTTVSDLKNVNGNIVSDDTEKADLLNTFFASVFVNEPPDELPIFDIRYHGTPVTDLRTNLQELTKHLKTLNACKSMGSDGCHPRVLRETADILNVPLQTIFDKTFIEGRIPTIWKDANISALYKNKGDKSKTTNYRPVSLTCLPSRICEKKFRDTIMNHMNKNNLFTECQYGF